MTTVFRGQRGNKGRRGFPGLKGFKGDPFPPQVNIVA